LQETFLPGELELYNKIKVENKKLNWLGGRIASKFAASHHSSLPFNKIEVLKDSKNSPYFLFEGNKIHISISHSSGIALAIVGDYGIDLESITPRKSSFIETAFSSAEIDENQLKVEFIEKVTTFWTMKEAHLKRMRVGIRINLHDVKIINYTVHDTKHSTSIVISPQGKSRCESYVGTGFIVTVSSAIDQS
jgi:phosphopantetheinyl transferase